MKPIAILGSVVVALSLALPLALLEARGLAAPAPAAQPSPASNPAAGAWEIDAVHSSVVFKVRHMGVAPFYGSFKQISGSVTLNADKPAESKVEITLPLSGIDTNNPGRDDHLKSPDFFNAAEFPEVKFSSKTVQKTDKGYKVEGLLTMHGVTKPVTLDVVSGGTAKSPKGEVAGFEVSASFKRSDFGMDYGLEGIGDEVTLMAGIECKPAK